MDASEEPEDKIEVVQSTEDNSKPEDGEPVEGQESSSITEEQWEAIKGMLEYLLGYREEDGHDPSKVFHKRVNKRNVPSYYDVIKEPMAFSNLKASLANQEYKRFSDFVRECALIWHNAHTYNRPDAGAYQDASTMKRLMEQEFQKIVEKGIVGTKDVEWPDLGEIPPVEELPEEDEEEEEEEDEEDEEEGDESDEDGQRKKRKGRRSSAVAVKGADAPRRRGRPPKVDTPMEARIKSILKGLRKVRDKDANPRIMQFEKLPDKAAMPEYYQEIKRPISIEQLKKSLKRKRYSSVDHFMLEVELMFENAKHFNEDDSQIFEDAVTLLGEAHRLAEIEKKRPDSDFVTEEGRKPRPGGIEYNGESWKVGDWVHLRNANDISKPIVAQIYRTWEDSDGQEWLNACWYYRPEQTVHHFEKHFWPNEVLKTGQYRDHRVEELIDRCFVMFYTRYTKGRPRGTPPQREVYVCEARYNEEKHRINKIKTWASCLPDEVRDQDYEMEMFENYTNRKVKKLPSPLVGTLNDDTKDASSPPQPRWGADNAPPIVGGIYKGPRDDNQSPPPEPTPEPTPQPPAPMPRQVTRTPSQDVTNQADQPTTNYTLPTLARPSLASAASQPSSSATQLQARPSQSASPAPRQIQQGNSASAAMNYPSTPAALQTPAYSHFGSSRLPQQSASQYAQGVQPLAKGQRMPDVFYLQAANAAIPEDIRNEFQQDEHGHVLFFSKPPIAVQRPEHNTPPVQLSTKLRAARIRSRLEDEKHVKDVEPTMNGIERPVKRTKQSEVNGPRDTPLAATLDSWRDWLNQHQKGTNEIWKVNHGENWEQAKRADQSRLVERQAAAKAHQEELDAKAPSESRFLEETRLMFRGATIYKDDINPRY